MGYEADLAVVSYVLKTKLKCTVTVKHINEQVSWQGFASGQVDAILENWGHDDLVDEVHHPAEGRPGRRADRPQGDHRLVRAAVDGAKVPGHHRLEEPEQVRHRMFKTSESGGKGQLLDGDPSYVTNDAALVKNLKLNFKVVQGGSEAALITSFRPAEAEQEAAAGLLLRAAVVLQRGPAGQGQPAGVHHRLRRRARPRSPATTRRTT